MPPECEDAMCRAGVVEVSGSETLAIQLLRDSQGRWFNVNLGAVDSITLATVITDEVAALLPTTGHDWTAVKFVSLPF